MDGDAEACIICLQPITERAVAVACNHLTFDFLCLVSWLQERATCPLCKAAVTEVQYDWRSAEDYKTYHVPKPEPARTSAQSSTTALRRVHRRDRRHTERWTSATEQALLAGTDPALERRRHVYREGLYSLHVGANRISQHRDFTPQTFTASPDLQSRARAFLRRELQVFSFLDTATAPRRGNRNYLVEYIVFVLKTNELKGASGHAEDLLADFLGRENARLVLHELEAWLRSPYARLAEWDGEVQYAGAGRAPKSGDS
ncbi:hypothetical protein LTR85_000793 [Meristemomyces frigidus]|nr:hypothetical protein LTR85_000793 [Meristemomyces frigidus]